MCLWQFKDTDGTWSDYDESVSSRIDGLMINKSIYFVNGKFHYRVKKSSETAGEQTNIQTSTKRAVRRVMIKKSQMIKKISGYMDPNLSIVKLWTSSAKSMINSFIASVGNGYKITKIKEIKI